MDLFEHMNFFEEVNTGLDILGQLRAPIGSGRKPGIARSLDFEFVEVEAGRAVFAGTPERACLQPDRNRASRVRQRASVLRSDCP